MTDPTPWYRSRRGIAVVLAYTLLTLAGIAVSTGWLVTDDFFLVPTGDGTLLTGVPGFVYLYGFLGGMAYAFTSIVAKFERGVTGVAKVGLRALAALPLAAGGYLLAGGLGIETTTAGWSPGWRSWSACT